MDAELKAKWVKALRSGEYQQTQMNLRDEKGFCCLGVLCDVMGARWKGHDPVVCDRAQGGYLDDHLLKKVGFSDPEQERLYKMNDAGTSFPTIADYIEANL